MTTTIPAVLAVDVGNSKTDLALVGPDGTVLGAVRGPSASHQAVGLERAILTLARLAHLAAAAAGLQAHVPYAGIGAMCMAGLDTHEDQRRVADALQDAGLADELLLRNDVFAVLRAGSRLGWGVAVVAGAGMNAIGVGPTGRIARFAGLGGISGDWEGIAQGGLAAAVRGRDGRGPRTVLEQTVPAHFGLGRPADVTVQLYDGRLPEDRLRELAPVVFAAAREGDEVAVELVEALADEIAAFANAAIRRTSTTRFDVDVVLAGGLTRASYPRLLAGVEARVREVAPRARIVVLDRPPVVGAALIGLDRHAPSGRPSVVVEERLRAELTEERLGHKISISRAATRVDRGEDRRHGEQDRRQGERDRRHGD
jgi:N-acetylglucosamine kinase-like BadF-type ATPase